MGMKRGGEGESLTKRILCSKNMSTPKSRIDILNLLLLYISTAKKVRASMSIVEKHKTTNLSYFSSSRSVLPYIDIIKETKKRDGIRVTKSEGGENKERY